MGLFTLANGTAEQLDIKEEAHEGADVNSVDFGAKQLLTAGDDGVRIWTITAQGLDESPQFIVGEKGDITLWAAFSADGQYFASGSKNKSTVTVYQKVSQAGAESFKEFNLLYGHKNSTQRGIFGPCGRQLVTVSSDATLRFWDLSGELAGKAELLTLPLPVRAFPPAPLWNFDFQCTPKGCWIAVPLLTGKLVIYELGSIYNCTP
ncbi:MAG: hypothetical protein SVR94_13690 [Pseudomonadota bacterium]|nr:hypothetical protein [Pseudomonadota bacterium]